MSTKRPKLAFSSSEGIRKMRKKLLLNQNEFWSRVGVTQSGGSRYESGRRVPTAVQMLLTITYGTDKQAEALVDHLRGANS